MDKAIKKRSPLRGVFTRNWNSLNGLLEEGKYVEARASLTTLEGCFIKISELDDQIMDDMLDENVSEEDIAKEVDTVYEYRSKLDLIKVRVLDITLPNNSADQNSVHSSPNSTTHSVPSYNLRLPKIEIHKFSGDLKEWLSFWNQFQRIHDDHSIPPIDKFYYLDQAIMRNSRAWRVVESFPHSEENYPLVIQSLKERFGREDLLIEVYIRELLNLALPSNKLSNLPEMYDKLECRLRALEVLGVTKGKCAAIICPLLESCMTEEYLRVWQRSCSSDEVLTAENRLDKFMEFMKNEVQNEERIDVALTSFADGTRNKTSKVMTKGGEPKFHKKAQVPTATGLMTVNDQKSNNCIFCDESKHSSVDCYKARDMNLSERIEVVKHKKCCLICMKGYHIAKFCKYKQKCPLCDKRHVILLCPNLKRSRPNVDVSEKKERSIVPGEENVLANVTSDNVLLPTLLVKIRGNKIQKTVRAVVDTGSQRSYILKKTAQEMNYTPTSEETIVHTLFGGQRSGICNHNMYKLYLTSIDGNYFCNFDVLDQEVICDSIPNCNQGPWVDEGNDLGISINNMFLKGSESVEILIGADVIGKMLTGNVKQLSCGVTAMETRLGWTLLGKQPNKPVRQSSAMLTTSMLVDDMNMSNLWKLDLLGITDPTESKTKTVIEQETDKFFQDTLNIDAEGRYEVKLPWKDSNLELSTNHEMALRRLESTVKKLEKDGVHAAYDEVFQEWLKEGVIEYVPESELNSVRQYLPHRHVVKESSTTKIRPVFDASAHVKKEPSLNDCLEKGCNMIEKIPPLLLRFRLKQIGVVADIRRAFLQISICPEDRNYLCFLWRDQTGKMVVFRHKRVVFGVVCSPYQLNAVIRYHLEKELEKSQHGDSSYSSETINILMNSFYVDNTVTSLNDHDELNTFMSEATALMAEGKFDLRGWEYTDPDLKSNTVNTNVLGLIWDRKEDILKVNIDAFKSLPLKITKRTILSVAHSVFDPIGFTCPVNLKPKLLLRELWNSNLGWDEPVNAEISDQFIEWMEQLRYLVDVKIPRWVLDTPELGKWSLHTFCDASELAYATAIFLRVVTESGISVQLVQAKTRVAPVKSMTIPRLELLAALIGTRLHNSVIDSLPEHCKSYFWSDSTTVLAWIRREEQWAPFVRNRVTEIRQTTKAEQWNHVPGSHNPADLPSRGCSTKKLLETSWWEGPVWLREPEDCWPAHDVNYDEDLIVKEKLKGSTSCLQTVKNETDDTFFKYFSRYEKNVRMVAWILRFSNNCKARNVKKTGPLSVEELETAEIYILKLVQKKAFPNLSDAKLLSLRPFQGADGLIRLKTKISNRPDDPDFRNPILLPKDHPIVKRLIMEMHTRHCHAGTQSLIAILRERYWILGGRKTIRSVTAKCMKCKRQEAKCFDAPTPPLPIERVRDAAAFEVTGVDLAGPLYLKNGKKCWVCLFTCGVIRAVHLELLMSLTTEDFLQALKRFISRRGRPAVIFSDNATNFKGTENLFSNIDWYNVQEFCTSVNRIKWKFNPPSAPWWGGFFERLIGLVKRVLRRILGKSSLNYCEMETMLCECESIINSRPLTFISDDQNDLSPITPAMFIQEIKENGVPEIDVIETTNLQKKLKYRAKLRQDLRKRFRTEYLGQLRQHAEKQKSSIKIGDIVMIENDNAKRLEWPLAKVTEVFPGRDGTVRLAQVTTANGGRYLKPIRRLYKMSS